VLASVSDDEASSDAHESSGTFRLVVWISLVASVRGEFASVSDDKASSDAHDCRHL
jgi:hypothetical protein